MTVSGAVPSAFTPPFEIRRPAAQTAGLVFSSPHSGRIYPPEFLALSKLQPAALRKSEDCLVDELFADMPRLGAPLISALFPRAYLDLNREPYELDPELVEAPLPDYANTHSVRVAGGLGTIARIVADGEEIYRQRLPLKSVLARIESLYFPFHAELTRLVNETMAAFGYSVLIDCHSMPSSAVVVSGGPRPDIAIGDRFGSACDTQLARFVCDGFSRRGYDVQMNRPYAGGFITEHHGKPARGLHALQIEVNRGLYLDEMRFRAGKGFDDLKGDLNAIFADVIEAAHDMLGYRAAAAE